MYDFKEFIIIILFIIVYVMMCSFVVVLREKGAVVFRAYSNAHTTRKGIEREVTERKIFQKRASSISLGFIVLP